MTYTIPVWVIHPTHVQMIRYIVNYTSYVTGHLICLNIHLMYCHPESYCTN